MAIYKWSDSLSNITQWSNNIKGVYLWESLVWPAWKPWVNTIAYWKFEDSLNDTSWTSPTYNLTNNSATISYGAWISWNCVNKWGNWYLQSTLNCNLFIWNFTLMFFIKFSSVSSVVRLMWEASNYTNIQYESWNGGLQWYNNNETWRTIWSWAPSSDTWYHIAITWDWSNYTAYLNGTAMTKTKQWTIASWNTWFVLWWNSSVNSTNFVGAFDELIIENKVWTASEISNYLSKFSY